VNHDRRAEVADFLDTKVKEIEARLRELRPLVEEFERLEAAAAALDGVEHRPHRAPVARATTNGNRRGRPRGSRGGNTRATQAVELVRTRPGITIPALAGEMGIKPNYLYRILPQLEEDGKVRREDKGWHPA
jgi:hypothetical protein